MQLVKEGATNAAKFPLPEGVTHTKITIALNADSHWCSGETSLEALEEMDAHFERKKVMNGWNPEERSAVFLGWLALPV